MTPSTTPEPQPSTDDESDIMGRHNHPRHAPPKRVELDLSAILSLDQKNQVQHLVNAILELIQQQTRDAFDNLVAGPHHSNEGIDPPKPTWNLVPNPRSVKYRYLYGLAPEEATTATESTGTLKQQDFCTAATKEQPPPATLPQIPPGHQLRIPVSVEEASVMSGKTDCEILADSVSELKRDMLSHFGKWRANVQKRVGDMIVRNGGNAGPPARRAPIAAGQGKSPVVATGSPSTALSVEPANFALQRLYPACHTPLADLTKEKRAIILHTVLLLLLGLEHYSSYSRALLLHLCSSLGVPKDVLARDEVRLAAALSGVIDGVTPDEIAQRRAEEAKTPRRAKLVSMAPAGAAQNGSGHRLNNAVSLAKPLIDFSIGTVFGGFGLGAAATATVMGPMAESTVAIGTLFGLYGARAGAKPMEAFTKDITDFAWLPLHVAREPEILEPKDLPAQSRRLRVSLGISGWLHDEDDLMNPCRALGSQTETYRLRWESESLHKMGSALETVLQSQAWSQVKKDIVARPGGDSRPAPIRQLLNDYPVFASLKNSVWPAELLKISKVIDNPWTVGMVRAEKAGQVLAEALINKVQGERSVSLIGFSLGARVIYACLMALAEKRAFGLVDNVAIIGAPCPTEIRAWAAMRSVTCGRMVNVYSVNDYLLGFLYRTGTWQYGCAGLQKICGVTGVDNLNVSTIVNNHIRYQCFIGSILKQIGWEDLDYQPIAEDEEKLAKLVAEENRLDQSRSRADAASNTRPCNSQKGDRLKENYTDRRPAGKGPTKRNRKNGTAPILRQTTSTSLKNQKRDIAQPLSS